MILREYSVGDEGDVDPPREGAYIGGGTSRLRGNVGDPQLVRPERVEMPFDEVGRALLLWSRARRSGRLGASDTAQAQVAHEAFDGAPGHVTGTVTLGDLRSVEHYMYLAGPQHRVVVLVDLGYLRLEGLVAQRPG